MAVSPENCYIFFFFKLKEISLDREKNIQGQQVPLAEKRHFSIWERVSQVGLVT